MKSMERIKDWSKNNDWATENLKEAPFWVDGMTPEEYDKEREYYLRNYDRIKRGELNYNRFDYKKRGI